MKNIVSFNTGGVQGMFISVPYNTIIEECHFKDKESLRFALMVCYGNKSSIPSFYPIVIPEGNYKIVGFSHKIINETIKGNLKMSFDEYMKLLRENDITVNYSDNSNYWLLIVLNQTTTK
jgi:hypothetical protein